MLDLDDLLPHDAHVITATKVFRDCGFTLHAIQHPRPAWALAALKAFNGMPETWKAPFAWGYYPNAYMRDWWESRR